MDLDAIGRAIANGGEVAVRARHEAGVGALETEPTMTALLWILAAVGVVSIVAITPRNPLGAAALYQHPTTGQTQLCTQDTNALMLWGFDTAYTACKDALERAGWERR
jgi:hypothetical protein